jgi:simple sugar transport system permease protein
VRTDLPGEVLAILAGRARRLVRPVVAVLVSLVVCGAILAVVGINPFDAYRVLFEGAFVGTNSLADTLLKMSPLLLAALGVAVAFKAGVFNIGAEGQMSAGAVTAALAALLLPSMPPVLAVIVAVVAGIVGGILMAGIAAVLKVRKGVNEVVTTLLLNYVGIYLAAVLVNGPLKDPRGGGYPQSRPLPDGIELPIMLPGTGVHAGLLLGLVAAAALAVVLARTGLGYEIRATGLSPSAAERAGVDTRRTVLIAFAVSGGLAGLAGAGEVLGLYQRLFENTTAGYGYVAIVVALVGSLHPLGIVVASFLFAGLLTGGNVMQQTTGAGVEIVAIIVAVTVMLLMVELRRRRRRAAAAADADEPPDGPAGEELPAAGVGELVPRPMFGDGSR